MKGHSAVIHRCLMLPSSLSPHVRLRHRPGGRGYLRNFLSHPLPLSFSSSPPQHLNVSQLRLSLSLHGLLIYSFTLTRCTLLFFSSFPFGSSILSLSDPSFHPLAWLARSLLALPMSYSIYSIQLLDHHNTNSVNGTMLRAHDVREFSALFDSSSLVPDDMMLSHLFIFFFGHLMTIMTNLQHFRSSLGPFPSHFN